MEFTKWVNGWGLGVAHPPLTEAQWAKNMTVRYVLPNTLNAGAVRLSFSNRFGPEEAELSRVTVAISADGKDGILPETLKTVTFGGKEIGKILPYGELVSDAISFSVHCGQSIAVSLYFRNFARMNTGFTYDNKFTVRRFIEGDHVSDPSFDPMQMSYAAAYNFLWSVDFLCTEESYAVAAFGDSLTSQEWVDFVVQYLAQQDGRRAIVRRAVSGSRIFGSYPALSYFHYGEDGFTRFAREVLHEGVAEVILFHGINDLIHPDGKNPMRPMSNLPSAEKMAKGLSTYVRTAENAGLKTHLATLLPIEGWRTYDLPRDDIRIAVNEWIRTQEGFLDFEKAVRNPDHSRAMLPECDRGDHLHASLEGYRRIANTVINSVFQKEKSK